MRPPADTTAILPPFDEARALAKVKLAEHAWNTRDPDRVVQAYSEDTQWRNPGESRAGQRLERAQLGRDGIPGDRVLYVVDERGQILSARTKPRLLGHRATVGPDGDVLVDGLPWRSSEVAAAVEFAAGAGARLVEATGNERFDILPLLVATDGAIEAFGHDLRRLRPNIVIAGVEGLAERRWPWRQLAAGKAVIALADLRERCIMTTWDPDT